MITIPITAEDGTLTTIELPDPAVTPRDVVFADFNANAKTAGMVLPAVLDGRGATYRMLTGSSTKAALVPVPTIAIPNPTNPFTLLVVGGNDAAHRVAGIDFRNFTLRGTPQGHLHNGLRVGYSTGAKITGGRIYGIPGAGNAPPKETFGVSAWHADGSTWTDVHVDGRDDTGKWVGASGIGINSTVGATYIGCSSKYSAYAMGLTQWKSRDTTLVDVDLSENRRAFNSEQCSGFLKMLRCNYSKQVSTSHHISLNGSVASVKVLIEDPVVEWPLRLSAAATYRLAPDGSKGVSPNPQKRSDVTVIIGGEDVSTNPAYVRWM